MAAAVEWFRLEDGPPAAVAREEARLRAVYDLDLLDTLPEPEFDEVAELAAAICGTPISAISLLDRDRQWFKAKVGLEAEETPREIAFCEQAIRQKGLFVVEDARADPRFAQHPFVLEEPYVKFYAGMPLVTAEGHALGTLCVVDRRPRRLSEQQERALQILARQVMGWIELRRKQKETAALLEEKERLAAWLAEYQEQLEAANDRLRELAATDELTGLKNRRAFEERLVFEFAMARRKGRELAVVILDADSFKRINDDLGHAAGDDVLRTLARVLQEKVRASDLAVRFGGEEFAVLLPDSTETQALVWCGRLQEALAEARWEQRAVTVSIGVAGLTRWCKDPAHLVERADEALYAAKARGKNCAVAASELMRMD